VGLVEHFDHGAPCVDALDDVDAILHRPSGTVPFCDNEHVSPAERIDGFLQLWPAFDRLAGRLLAVDFMAPLGAKDADLAVQILVAPNGYRQGRYDQTTMRPLLNEKQTRI
jgi:hypothetical protein